MQPMNSKSSTNAAVKPGQYLSGTIGWCCCVLLLFVFSTLPVHAHFGASISGTVIDPSRAAIPGAAVTLSNAATQQMQTTTTNATGLYHFVELPPGHYSVAVTATGFKKNNLTDVVLAAETPRDVEVMLQPGGVTETVEVRGDEVPLLEVSDANIGTMIDSEQIQRLPNTKQPVSDLYSLEVQYQLPCNFVGTLGYTGSVGRHFARLVNQNFIFSQCYPATTNCGAATSLTPVNAAYFAQTDSNQSYNALNVNLTRHVASGLFFSAYYTYSKSLDQVSHGDAADSNANQTNPANNATEWGPSDYDVRQRITVTGVKKSRMCIPATAW